MVTAERKMHVEADGTEVSLGQVGEPGAVRVQLLESLLDSGIAPLHVICIASATAASRAATSQALAMRTQRPRSPHPAWMRPALGAPDHARARLEPRPASAHRQPSPGPALPRPSPPPRRRPPSRPGPAAQVPVIAPVAIGSDGMSYNVNADTMSGAIAAALSARALLLLTDVAGVLDAAPEDGGKLLPTLSLDDVSRLLQPAPAPEPCPQPEPPTPAQPLTPTSTQTQTQTRTLTPTLTSPEPGGPAQDGGRHHGGHDPQARDGVQRRERRLRQRRHHGRPRAALHAPALLRRGRRRHRRRRERVRPTSARLQSCARRGPRMATASPICSSDLSVGTLGRDLCVPVCVNMCESPLR